MLAKFASVRKVPSVRACDAVRARAHAFSWGNLGPTGAPRRNSSARFRRRTVSAEGSRIRSPFVRKGVISKSPYLALLTRSDPDDGTKLRSGRYSDDDHAVTQRRPPARYDASSGQYTFGGCLGIAWPDEELCDGAVRP